MYADPHFLASSIPQHGSVGQLVISYDGFKALHRSMGSVPQVLEMVRAFGVKVNNDANPIPPHHKHLDHPQSTYCMSKLVVLTYIRHILMSDR